MARSPTATHHPACQDGEEDKTCSVIVGLTPSLLPVCGKVWLEHGKQYIVHDRSLPYDDASFKGITFDDKFVLGYYVDDTEIHVNTLKDAPKRSRVLWVSFLFALFIFIQVYGISWIANVSKKM